jgi:hypothetical protein
LKHLHGVCIQPPATWLELAHYHHLLLLPRSLGQLQLRMLPAVSSPTPPRDIYSSVDLLTTSFMFPTAVLTSFPTHKSSSSICSFTASILIHSSQALIHPHQIPSSGSHRIFLSQKDPLPFSTFQRISNTWTSQVHLPPLPFLRRRGPTC